MSQKFIQVGLIGGKMRNVHRGVLALAVLALVGCGLGTSTPSVSSVVTPPPSVEVAPTATVPPTEVPRHATIQSLEGTVEVRHGTSGDFVPLDVNTLLVAGDEITTGADGNLVLLLDDGTVIAVVEESTFVLNELEGSPETPLSRFFLNVGQVFSIRDEPLPDGALYEVETPTGVAGVRGSAMGVSYFPDVGSQVTCLFGHCGARIGDADVDLLGGQTVDMTDAGLSDVAPLDPGALQQWTEVYGELEDTGVPVQANPLDTGCACDGTTLACDDGSRSENSSACGGSGSPGGSFPLPDFGGAPCACEGTTLVCTDQGVTVTFPDSVVCGGAGQECYCAETSLVCSDGSVSFDDPACGGSGSGLPGGFSPDDLPSPEDIPPGG